MVATAETGSDRWLSSITAERAVTNSSEALIRDADAPDFGAIPRDKTGSRAAAVLALYESDLTNRPAVQCIEWVSDEIGLSKKLRRFAFSLADHADRERIRIDRRLNRYSKHRTMAEASPVARNILRAALVELDLYPKTKVAVVVSEAVKLTQIFDTQRAGRFVNGVLGAMVRDAERDESSS